MEEIQPTYENGMVSLTLNGGVTAELTPQECWQFVETTCGFLEAQAHNFDPKPLHVVQRKGRNFNVVRSNLGFWRSVESGRWEPQTFEVFDRLITSESVFLDVGAWIGPTSLYGAQLARMTYSFEPDPVAYKEFEENLRANSEAPWRARIEALNVAVAEVAGSLKIGSRADGGDSMSSALFAGEQTAWTVDAISLDAFVAEHGLETERLFLKIDIEGGEYALIPSLTSLLRSTNSDLLLSIHPPFLWSSLSEKNGRTVFGRVRTRLEFARCHLKLARALPYKHLTSPSGRRIRLRREVLRALLVGRFVQEILASDRDPTD